MTITTRIAKFGSECPACGRELEPGDIVAKTHDHAWRCAACTAVFDELGPVVRCIDIAAAKADRARRAAVRAKHPVTRLWDAQKASLLHTCPVCKSPAGKLCTGKRYGHFFQNKRWGSSHAERLALVTPAPEV